MRSGLTLLPWLVLLGSCGSPPKPPTVDESTRRPVNSSLAVELQVCKNDLQNTRIVASESGRIAESTAVALDRAAVRRQAMAAMQTPQGNSVFTVRFEFGSAQLDIPAATAAALIEDARNAPLVVLRGRTDGATEAPAESRVARDRANAVRDYLVASGVDPSRIRATYQPIGDHAADNASPAGRAMNRRVEIEVYRATPVVAMASLVAMPSHD